MPNVVKYRRGITKLATQLVEPAGYTVTLTHPKTVTAHYRLTIEGPGGKRFVMLPGTPRSCDEQRNYLRQWIRRTLVELGS